MNAVAGPAAALAPVREHMRRGATERAAAIRADARREAAKIIAEARSASEAIMAQARAAGRAEAAPVAAAELGRARREARSTWLRAQRAARDELRRQVRAGVAALQREPGYDRLTGRLTRMAALAAGPDATIAPAPGGGVMARARGVVVDCSLRRLADMALDALGADVRELWTP
jgi:vacuolar-type H+-ATPase subunit E/Vma4